MAPSRKPVSIVAIASVSFGCALAASCTTFGAGADPADASAADAAPSAIADTSAPPVDAAPDARREGDAGPGCTPQWLADFEDPTSLDSPWTPQTNERVAVLLDPLAKGRLLGETIDATRVRDFAVVTRPVGYADSGLTLVSFEIGDVELEPKPTSAAIDFVVAQLPGLVRGANLVVSRMAKSISVSYGGPPLLTSNVADDSTMTKIDVLVDVPRRRLSARANGGPYFTEAADLVLGADGKPVAAIQLGLFFPNAYQAPAAPPTRVRYDNVRVSHCNGASFENP